MGAVGPNQRRVDPLTHVRKVRPDLKSWEDVARAVGANGADIERVRHLTARFMREVPGRVIL